jgi:hypothetical protein
MLEMLKAAPPVLVRVTTWDELMTLTGSLPKLRLEDERLVTGPDTPPTVPAPLPDRLTDCGLPVALSVRVIAAVRVPVAVG